MDDDEITGHLERLDAQIEALRAGLGAIARSMPNNDEVLRRFDLRAETLRGFDGARAVSERYLAALDVALDATRSRLALAPPREPREAGPTSGR